MKDIDWLFSITEIKTVKSWLEFIKRRCSSDTASKSWNDCGGCLISFLNIDEAVLASALLGYKKKERNMNMKIFNIIRICILALAFNSEGKPPFSDY